MKNKSGWVYSAEAGGFSGIWYSDGNENPFSIYPYSNGPFKTFSEAKKDALEYFRTDILYARLAIQDIKKTKKPVKK